MADTLLLADDEAGITALMRQYFEAAGYRVVCAGSAGGLGAPPCAASER